MKRKKIGRLIILFSKSDYFFCILEMFFFQNLLLGPYYTGKKPTHENKIMILLLCVDHFHVFLSITRDHFSSKSRKFLCWVMNFFLKMHNFWNSAFSKIIFKTSFFNYIILNLPLFEVISKFYSLQIHLLHYSNVLVLSFSWWSYVFFCFCFYCTQ